MKQKIGIILTVVAFIVFGFVVANAAEDTITATVTFEQIALTVSDKSISYGTIAASGTQDTVTLTDSQTVTNSGNLNEDFDIKALATTTGGTCTHWSILASGAPGANQYGHAWSITGGSGSDWDRFSSTYEEFVSDKAPAGTATLDLKIFMPSSSDCAAAQNVDVTIQASAHI
jgi:hypothetical protein